MGGDVGLAVTIPAVINALKKKPKLNVILVGDEHQILKRLGSKLAKYESRIVIHHAEQVVAMDEPPSTALRTKKNSSMRKAINLVKEGQAQGCVSAGNTGALMATARFVLKTLPGIDRPAIISELPNIRRKTRVLDLGANVDSCAEHLFQFAVMGNVLVSAVENISRPKVALLNIGVEDIKGNDQIKRTAHMLSEAPDINYIGFVEADHILTGEVDLVVCDGFVGNVALKASEGTVRWISHHLKAAFKNDFYSKCVGLLAKPIFKRLATRLDPAKYNGASLLGVNGVVIKSHGGTNILGFESAIVGAISEVQSNVADLIREQVADFLLE